MSVLFEGRTSSAVNIHDCDLRTRTTIDLEIKVNISGFVGIYRVVCSIAGYADKKHKHSEDTKNYFFHVRSYLSPLSHHAGREVCPLKAAVPDLPLSEN